MWNSSDVLPNVAFKTPDSRKVVIVLNTNESAQSFNIRENGKLIQYVATRRFGRNVRLVA